MSKRFATNPTAPKAPKAARAPRKGKPAPAEEPVQPVEDSQPDSNIPLAQTEEPVASLPPTTTNQAAGTEPVAQPAQQARSMKMADLNLTLSTAPRKSKRIVIYNIEGRTGSVQFLSTLFGGSQKDGGTPPATLKLTGEFAEPKPKVEKAKETPEERKARLAALPKLTLAEKVARAEKRAEELRAKLAKGSEQPAAAPAGAVA